MKKKYNIYTVFLAGLLCIIIVLTLGALIRRANKAKKQNLLNSQIVAPYYDPKVFHIPKDIQVQKSVSESTKLASKQIKLPVIMYHYVEYVKDINDVIRKKLDISPDLFEGHLRSLYNADYRTYFVKNIPDILEGKIEYSKKTIFLTFDDGYEDFYSVVFPLLKKYQMKATMYIVYDFIGKKGFMTEAEIKEILASGLVELGSHTLDHLYLKLMPESTARKQVIESKKKLEDRFNITIMTFAYPYGAFSKETVDLVKEAGYTAAVSVIPGMLQSNDNLFYLSRVRPGIFTPATIIKVLENYNK
ncbi:polysaccharide deacetylase family protein [Candidatus Roizmanbacteria bacterium]|nr:polysaccharide deacetylase family protein [Candidatus Roizmanbacteria bacterium]